MSKFRPYPRAEYNLLFRQWAKRNTKLLVVVAAGDVALLAAETGIFTYIGPHDGLHWWFLGVLQALTLGIALHLINAAFLAYEREAILQLRGAWGEEATRDELKRARRRGLIWGWVDSVGLRDGDLDHVVVTRDGGMLVVDSKWRSDGKDTGAMADSAARAHLRAQGVAQSLLKSERGSHRAKGHAVTVRPIVVVWGPAQHHVPDHYDLNGIPFIAGRRLLAWLKDLEGERVSRAAAKEILSELQKFRAGTFAAEAARKE